MLALLLLTRPDLVSLLFADGEIAPRIRRSFLNRALLISLGLVATLILREIPLRRGDDPVSD